MSAYDEDMWMLFELAGGDERLLIRSRPNLPAPERRATYRYLIEVRWAYEPAAGGMPTIDDETHMNALADALADAANTDWSVEVASITGMNAKEWHFYTPNTSTFVERFIQLLEACDPFPIQLEVFEDPEWDGLVELLDKVK